METEKEKENPDHVLHLCVFGLEAELTLYTYTKQTDTEQSKSVTKLMSWLDHFESLKKKTCVGEWVWMNFHVVSVPDFIKHS